MGLILSERLIFHHVILQRLSKRVLLQSTQETFEQDFHFGRSSAPVPVFLFCSFYKERDWLV